MTQQQDTAAPTDEDVLVKTLRIAARPETVFTFFVDPERMTQWLAEEVTLDPRVGGACHQVHRGNDGKRYNMVGEYLEVDPPRRVAWSWAFAEPDVEPSASRVEVELEPDGDGTLLTLSHFAARSMREDHEGGWAHFFPILAEKAAAAEAAEPSP